MNMVISHIHTGMRWMVKLGDLSGLTQGIQLRSLGWFHSSLTQKNLW